MNFVEDLLAEQFAERYHHQFRYQHQHRGSGRWWVWSEDAHRWTLDQHEAALYHLRTLIRQHKPHAREVKGGLQFLRHVERLAQNDPRLQLPEMR